MYVLSPVGETASRSKSCALDSAWRENAPAFRGRRRETLSSDRAAAAASNESFFYWFHRGKEWVGLRDLQVIGQLEFVHQRRVLYWGLVIFAYLCYF